MRNKRKWKRLIAVVLAGCMMAGCLAACGTKDDKDQNEEGSVKNNEETEKKDPEEQKEPAKLSYWCALDSNAQATLTSFNDMEILNDAQEIVNVDVTYTHPAAGTESEQFNLKLTNMELEDIMENSWGSYPGGPSPVSYTHLSVIPSV